MKYKKKKYGLKKNKTRNRLIALGVACMLIISTFMYSNSLIHSKMDNNINDATEYSSMIILGAGLWGDQVSPKLKLRLDTALRLINENKKLKIVVSGGQGEDELVSEAYAMKEYLVKNGVNQRNIYIEDKSTSTVENLKYSKEILEDLKLEKEKVIIVSTDFHMYRSGMIAGNLELDYGLQTSPNMNAKRAENIRRENFALIKDFLFTVY